MNSKDMFDNIQIPSLETFLDEIPEHQTVIVESLSVDDRKTLTRIKNELSKDDVLIDYTYYPKRGGTPASGKFVVENKDIVLSRLPENLIEQIK